MERFNSLATDVVGISVDPVETSRKMSADLELSFPVAADPDRRLIKALGIYDEPNDIAWPAVYVVGPDGKIEWRDLPDSYVLEKRPTAAQLIDVIEKLAAASRPASATP